MRGVIKRNKFTILLGLVLSIIFAVIIILSQNRDNIFILTPAKRNESFNIDTKTQTNQENQQTATDTTNQDKITIPGSIENEVTPNSNVIKPADRADEIIANMEPINLSFTDENGFTPKSVTATQNQRLVWTNNTNRIIKITQIVKRYENLPETIEIGPGQTYGIQLSEAGNWSFKEIEKNSTGSIFVYEKKSNRN